MRPQFQNGETLTVQSNLVHIELSSSSTRKKR